MCPAIAETQLLYNAAPVVDYCYVDFTFTVPLEPGEHKIAVTAVFADGLHGTFVVAGKTVVLQ